MAQFQELNEDQWTLIQEFMAWFPPKERGKPRTNLKRVWNAILYILTHGCRWEDLPKDARYAHRAPPIRWSGSISCMIFGTGILLANRRKK